MRVRVMVAVPAQEPLRESAAAAMEGRPAQIPIESASTPTGFKLDPRFSAVPLGSVGARVVNMDTVQPDKSEDFVVRGDVEVDSAEDIPETLDGRPVFADPLIAPFVYCGAAARGAAADVANRLDLAQLHAKGLDGRDVALAIVDTGINLNHLTAQIGSMPRFDASNSWNPAGASSTPGQYPVDHGTMCAYDALLVAPRAALLDYPVLSHSAAGGNVTGRSISSALQAYAHLLANFAVAFAPGGPHNYKGLVVSNSWGIYHPSWDFPAGHPGRFCDNPSHPFATIVRALTQAGADVVFAAGNCGSDCPDARCQGRSQGAIMGSSAYDEVLTVAACLATTEERLGYSSQGPSIPGMPREKPDITGYSHFLGSEAFGPGSPDSGTSTACPVVAGCLAAIRTQRDSNALPPANLIAQVKLTARQAAGLPSGWNADFGHGIIQPVNLAASLGL